MKNKFLLIVLMLFSLVACKKTYVEPYESNVSTIQTNLTGTNWIISQSPFFGVILYDTLHFTSTTQYFSNSSPILHNYSIYTSFVNEDISFEDATFWDGKNCGSILGLGFSTNPYFIAKFKNLYGHDSLNVVFTKF